MRHALLLFTAIAFAPTPSLAQDYAAPQPYGGDKAVQWMLEREMRFPAKDLEAGMDGETTVSFKVLADGTAKDIHVTLPLDPACDAEALRLVKLIRWVPASVGGTPLDHDHSIAIPFHAKRYKKWRKKITPCERPASTTPDDPSGTLIPDNQLDSVATPLILYGLRGLPQYLADNLKYPPEAFRLDIQGKVTIEFVVELSGNISNLRTLNFLGGGCDAEAMRLARTICWVPAVKDGKHVRSVVKQDILFRLNPSLR